MQRRLTRIERWASPKQPYEIGQIWRMAQRQLAVDGASFHGELTLRRSPCPVCQHASAELIDAAAESLLGDNRHSSQTGVSTNSLE